MPEHDSTFFGRLASWAVDPGTPPDAAIENAKRAIADLVGVSIAARDAELVAVLRRVHAPVPEGEGASVIGQGSRMAVQHAVFCNAVLGHALDFDDSHSDLGGHPSTVVFPAALAVAESLGRSGEELLRAYIVGVEVAAALGRALNPAHYDSGWHPTATLGSFGAAAAAARLLRLDVRQLSQVFGLTVGFCSGVKASFGTAAKPLQVGNAAMSGVLAAQLVAAGASAPEGSFEGSQGFLAVLQRTSEVPGLTLPGRDGAPWSLAEPGVIIKRYPCCGSTHAAADAALELRKSWGSRRIDSVRIGLHPKRLGHVNRPHPVSGYDAKFSVQYVVARALIDGAVTLRDFDDDVIGDEAVESLLGSVVAEALDVPDERVEDRYVAEVSIAGEGAVETVRLPMAVGRQRGVPLPWDGVRAKFDQCIAATLGTEDRDELWRRLMSLETEHDVTQLAALLRDRPARQQ